MVKKLWVFDPESYRLTIGRGASSTRGIEYWTDGEIERIFIATRGKQLVSIDIRTGLPDRISVIMVLWICAVISGRAQTSLI